MSSVRRDVLYSMAETPRLDNKIRQKVMMTLSNGETVEGYVFTGFRERPLDMLNDPRPFIPFEKTDGKVILIGKQSIIQVDIVEGKANTAPGVRRDNNHNPFYVLEIPETATLSQARHALRTILEQMDSARLQSQGYHSSVVQAAEELTQKMQEAYQRVATIIQNRLSE